MGRILFAVWCAIGLLLTGCEPNRHLSARNEYPYPVTFVWRFVDCRGDVIDRRIGTVPAGTERIFYSVLSRHALDCTFLVQDSKGKVVQTLRVSGIVAREEVVKEGHVSIVARPRTGHDRVR